jgi:hypothetical protein
MTTSRERVCGHQLAYAGGGATLTGGRLAVDARRGDDSPYVFLQRLRSKRSRSSDAFGPHVPGG